MHRIAYWYRTKLPELIARDFESTKVAQTDRMLAHIDQLMESLSEEGHDEILERDRKFHSFELDYEIRAWGRMFDFWTQVDQKKLWIEEEYLSKRWW